MKTYHQGAQEERNAWRDKLQKVMDKIHKDVLTEFDKFSKERVKRYRSRKGGL